MDEGNRKRTRQRVGVHGRDVVYGERLDEISREETAMSQQLPASIPPKKRRLNPKLEPPPPAPSPRALARKAEVAATTTLSVLKDSHVKVTRATTHCFVGWWKSSSMVPGF